MSSPSPSVGADSSSRSPGFHGVVIASPPVFVGRADGEERSPYDPTRFGSERRIYYVGPEGRRSGPLEYSEARGPSVLDMVLSGSLRGLDVAELNERGHDPCQVFVFRAQPEGEWEVVVVVIPNLLLVVAPVVPHSLATHHHVYRGPRSSERHEPGTEPSPVSSYWGSDVSPGYMPTRSVGPRDPGSGDSSAGSVATSVYSPYYHPLRSRSGRNNADSSVERPLLLRPEVDIAVEASDHAQGGVASPVGSVVASVSASRHHRSVRSRAKGPYRRDLEEEVDETTFSISSHARRSLEVQEGWKAVRDGKSKRRREEVEDDDPARADGHPEGGGDEEGPDGGCAV